MGLSEKMEAEMAAFAAEVGATGPVAVVGSGSRGDLGGSLHAGTRVLRAPSGSVEHRREELTVTATAGTPVAELEAVLADSSQTSGLDLPSLAPGSTVGSAVATATGGLHGLAHGHMRDTVLGIVGVDAAGRVVHAGGETVKNVSGFDLCRLLTGSLGTLALIGAVTLRTRPLPRDSRWFRARIDPFAATAPGGAVSCVLWDGQFTWVNLAGHPGDLAEATNRLETLGPCESVEGPPDLPPHRWSVDPTSLRDWSVEPPVDRRWVAEVGVGIVHADQPQPPRPLDDRLAALHRAVKGNFDPEGRLAPGRSPMEAGSPGS